MALCWARDGYLGGLWPFVGPQMDIWVGYGPLLGQRWIFGWAMALCWATDGYLGGLWPLVGPEMDIWVGYGPLLGQMDIWLGYGPLLGHRWIFGWAIALCWATDGHLGGLWPLVGPDGYLVGLWPLVGPEMDIWVGFGPFLGQRWIFGWAMAPCWARDVYLGGAWPYASTFFEWSIFLVFRNVPPQIEKTRDAPLYILCT